MIGMKINQAKSLFFDRAIVSAVDKATRSNLSKAGAFVRRTMKGLIRKGKKSSVPGKPPKSHTGLLKDFIYFVYEPRSRSVVVGPAKLNKPGLAPATLEHGGTTTIVKRVHGKRTHKNVRIAARPYAKPALDKERPKFAQFWADTVKG